MTGPQSTEWIQTGTDDTPPAPAARSPLASFAWFVLCGGGVSLAASAAVPWAAELLPWPVANALITVVTTLLCTELHARVTFKTGRRAGWRRHLQSAGSAMAAYVVTTAAVLTLDALQPSAGMLWQQAAYLGASGTAGTGRFLVLRLIVFTDSQNTAELRAQSPFQPENNPQQAAPARQRQDDRRSRRRAAHPVSPSARCVGRPVARFGAVGSGESDESGREQTWRLRRREVSGAGLTAGVVPGGPRQSASGGRRLCGSGQRLLVARDNEHRHADVRQEWSEGLTRHDGAAGGVQ